MLLAIVAFRTWRELDLVLVSLTLGDEGLDSGQLTRELIRYHEERLGSKGEAPYDEYGAARQERERRGLNLRSWQNEESGSE
jgi:hypothetical protein